MKRIMIMILVIFGGIQGCPTLVTRPGTYPQRFTIFYKPPLFLLKCPLRSSVFKLTEGESDEDNTNNRDGSLTNGNE